MEVFASGSLARRLLSLSPSLLLQLLLLLLLPLLLPLSLLLLLLCFGAAFPPEWRFSSKQLTASLPTSPKGGRGQQREREGGGGVAAYTSMSTSERPYLLLRSKLSSVHGTLY